METLTITTLTSHGQAYDIDFPLHPNTRSADAVGALVTGQLVAISAAVANHKGLSDGDILQALAMTLAIRARMAGSTAESMQTMVHDLFDSAYAAALASAPTLTGHA